MARKRTPLQRLIEHASTADESEVNTLIEALQAVKAARFAAKKATRKPRSDAGKSRTPTSTPSASNAGEPSSSGS